MALRCEVFEQELEPRVNDVRFLTARFFRARDGLQYVRTMVSLEKLIPHRRLKVKRMQRSPALYCQGAGLFGCAGYHFAFFIMAETAPEPNSVMN